MMSAPQASLLFRTFPSPLLHLPQCTLRRPNTSPLFNSLKPRLPRRLSLSLRVFHPDPVPEAVSSPSPIEIPSQEMVAGPASAAGSAVAVENQGPFMLLLMAVLDSMRRGLHRARTSKCLSWWPLWRQERIDVPIEMADKNPKDVALQNVLLAELNNHWVFS